MVQLNRNNSNWSFEERRKINENWDILEGVANSTASGNNGLRQELNELKVTVGENTTRSTNALQTANQAGVKADSVLVVANRAEAKSDQATNVANQARTTADGIDSKVNQATSIANRADVKSDLAINTANQANTKSDYVQSQLDQVISEGDSNAEVVQARDGKTNLRQRLEDDVLSNNARFDRIDLEKATKIELDQKITNFKERNVILENSNHFGTYDYTAFFSGINYGGRELHFARTSFSHVNNDTRIVAFEKLKNGRFTRKIVGNIDYSIGDFRDVGVHYNPVSKVIVLSISIKLLNGTYTNYFYTLNSNLDAISTSQILGMEGYFKWGNVIVNHENRSLILGYQISDTFGVSLFKSVPDSGGVNSFRAEKIFDVFPGSASLPTEATMGIWGEKLFVISRQNNGNMVYRETYDQTGVSGWGPIVNLGFIGDAPAVLPYTPSDKPLFLAASAYGVGGSGRNPYFKIIRDISKANDAQTVNIDFLDNTGGYTSLVPNENGLGVMYYKDEGNGTNVYYKELNPDAMSQQVEISANAEKWYNLTYQNGWTTQTPGRQAIAKVDFDGNLMLKGHLTATTKADGTTIFSLPLILRPRFNIFTTAVDSQGNIFSLLALSSGEVKIYKLNPSATSVFIDTTFVGALLQ